MLESTFVEAEGHRVHLWQGGTGFPVLMLHGVGPGTSIVGNYSSVLEPLAEHCRIVAADLFGFGKSEFKAKPPYFDVELWVRQRLALLEHLGDGSCGIGIAVLVVFRRVRRGIQFGCVRSTPCGRTDLGSVRRPSGTCRGLSRQCGQNCAYRHRQLLQSSCRQ